MPPWPPVQVEREAGSVRDGRAVLRLPAGLRWVAAHQPGEYDPPHEFADALTSLPLSAVLPWRHTHQFVPAGQRATRVTDVVETPLLAGYSGRCSPTGTGNWPATWPPRRAPANSARTRSRSRSPGPAG